MSGSRRRGTRRRNARPVRHCALVAGALAALSTPLSAQTDYYNLDKQRPLRVEDAYAAERHAVELQIAPLSLARADGALRYAPAVELKYGLFAGMEVAVGVDADIVRRAGVTTGSFGALDASALYNLNSESLGMPAFGVRLSGHRPLESGAGTRLELRGIVTRTLGGAWRAHLNGGAAAGEDAAERWWTGVAVDYVLPFRSLLLLAETYYAHPRDGGAARLHSAAGLRYQLTPWTGLDAGGGVDWSRAERGEWRLTFGITTAFAVRPLIGLR